MFQDAELKKRMRELGLDDKGSRKVLVSRHQRFTVLWNAQCEAPKPQSKLEIIMQVCVVFAHQIMVSEVIDSM